MSRGRPLIKERSLHLQPSESHPRLAFRRRQWVLPIGRPRTEKPHGVGADLLSCLQPHVQLVRLRFDLRVKVSKAAQHLRRHHAIDRDRFRPTSLRYGIKVRPPPGFSLVRAYPNRVRQDAQLVVARHGGLELAPLRLERLIAAGHHSDAFQLLQGRLVLSHRHGRLERPDIRLRCIAQGRKGGPLRAAVEFPELHLLRPIVIVACVVAHRRGRRSGGSGRHHFAQHRIGRLEIARHLHVRNIQRFPDPVEAEGLAILGQSVPHQQPWRIEKIPQRIFILIAVHAPLGAPAVFRRHRLLGSGQ